MPEILRKPTEEDLKIGQGIPSGRDGQWSILDLSALKGIVDGFEIWYTDGSTYNGSTEKDWHKAPKKSVQFIIYFNNGGRTWAQGYDEYTHPDFNGSKYGEMMDLNTLNEMLLKARSKCLQII